MKSIQYIGNDCVVKSLEYDECIFINEEVEIQKGITITLRISPERYIGSNGRTEKDYRT